MNNNKIVKFFSRFSLTILIFLVVKFFGLVPGIIIVISYSLLEKKFGAIYSLLVSIIVGLAVLIILAKLFARNYPINSLTTNPSITSQHSEQTENLNQISSKNIEILRNETVNAVNKISPKKVDENTTLIGAESKNDAFYYKYNIIDIKPATLASYKFYNNIKHNLLINYCSSQYAIMRNLYPGGVYYVYSDIIDKNNQLIVKLTSSMCVN